MIKDSSNSEPLRRSSLALVNFKGGAGKTVLAGNLASIAANVMDWNVCVVDLDASAPLTRLALGDVPLRATVREALGMAGRGEDIADVLRFAKNLGFWLLPGSVKGIISEDARHLPRLIQTLKGCRLGDRPVDFIVVDTPGENKVINGAVMASVDFVAMPLALNATDMTATAVTISFVRQMQTKRGGSPIFLGMIPNRVQRRGTYEKAFLAQVLQANVILPYIPESNIIKGSYARSSRSGGEVPILFAPKAGATQRLVRLFCEMNNPEKKFAAYVEEIRDYLGLVEAFELEVE
jgi:cellulose biosynthesis protein BcsQ